MKQGGPARVSLIDRSFCGGHHRAPSIAPLEALVRAEFAPQANSAFVPDVELELTAQPGHHQILSGTPTSTWSYRGKLLKGRAGTLENTDSYLGPTIRLRKSDKVRVDFRNELPETTTFTGMG